MLDKGIGVEEGIWNARAAEILLGSGFAEECLRILIEPAGEPCDTKANLAEIETVLNRVSRSRLLHGLDASAWKFVRLTAERTYDTRTGFEDVLQLPDGSLAKSNAELVAAERRIVVKGISP